MKRFAFTILFLLLLPISLAQITVEVEQDTFLLGEDIAASASILQEEDFIGVVQFQISCPASTLIYSSQPVQLDAGFRTQIDADPLEATPSLKGVCKIQAQLLDTNGRILQQHLSDSFEVTSALFMHLTSLPQEVLPDSIAVFGGSIRDANNQLRTADLTFDFDGDQQEIQLTNGQFRHEVSIRKDIRSYNHTFIIQGQDEKGNIVYYQDRIDVKPVPSDIALVVDDKTYKPGQVVHYAVIMLDQGGDTFLDEAQVELRDEQGNVVLKEKVPTEAPLEYHLGQFSSPGMYTLHAAYDDLSATHVFSIPTIEDLQVTTQGHIIYIENRGNVPFDDKLTFLLESDDQTKTISEKMELPPGQQAQIDLSEQARSGTYTLLQPLGENEEGIAAHTVVAKDITIEDGKESILDVGHDVTEGMKGITGNIIGADGIVARSSWLAPLILLFLILGLVWLFAGPAIKDMVRKRQQ